ncbi:MAG TPA: ATP-binding protein [Spirochaetota bacterium]|nr:ATP-binding protein [Spirochaetota bacterium]
MRYINKTNRSRWMIIGGISIFLILFITAGFLGLFFLRKVTTDTQQYILAVDRAREAQVNFQRQFHLWKTIVLEGDNIDSFKKNYHAFSYQADRVQDYLFNLKIICTNFDGVPQQIEHLKALHKSITGNYNNLTVQLKENNFRNRSQIIAASLGTDTAALQKMDAIVDRIELLADREINGIYSYYFTISLLSFLFLGITVFVMGTFLARELIKTQDVLEIKVSKRTRELATTNSELQKEIMERTQAEESLRTALLQVENAHKRISVSEEKYRRIVEESQEIIFSLDNRWMLITANKALKNLFKIDVETVKTTNFFELLDRGIKGDEVNKRLIKEKLELFSQERNPIEFNAAFQGPRTIEPIEMKIRLEYINPDGNYEILGKARKVTEDNLVQFLESEKRRFSIKNSLLLTDDLAHRITRNLVSFMEHKDINLIRIAVREILINAIEHGNLNITFEEKTSALLEDRYFRFIGERQNDPRFCNKKVYIDYMVDAEKVIYRITDEGNGFDHEEMFKKADDVNEEMEAHGRGITMAKNIFDTVKYNKKGNQVLLVKNFSRE